MRNKIGKLFFLLSVNGIFICSLFLLSGCSQKKNKIEYLICRDSIQYWDFISNTQQKSEIDETYCFKKGGSFIRYYFGKDGNRRILTNADNEVVVGKWSISNDSIFTIDFGRIKIANYNEDTIFFGKSKKMDMLIRVKGKIDLINLGDPGDTLPKFKLLPPI